MLWCGMCKPCADGYPNHCERLDEIGFNVNGAYAKYSRMDLITTAQPEISVMKSQSFVAVHRRLLTNESHGPNWNGNEP